MPQSPFDTSPQGINRNTMQGAEQYNQAGGSRRPGSSGVQQSASAYGFPESYPAYRGFDDRGSARQPSSSPTTSSLSGAMANTQISTQYSVASSGMSWAPSSMTADPYSMMPESYLANAIPATNQTGAFSGQFSSYAPSTQSPTGLPTPDYGQFPPYMRNISTPRPSSTVGVAPNPRGRDEELRRLHKRINELESINEAARNRIADLENELRVRPRVSGSPPSAAGPSSLPSPVTPSVSTSMQRDWRARTDARVKIFCSLNRAGNALCAWHDSRRERREFPPRMAPPGYLNCGCTYEEALFEESLSRHDVGSYHPGESVRMDPALRNPLLKLLKRRYGYQDGDFERDSTTGGWVEGEGAALWEAKLAQGPSAMKKVRGDERR